MAQAYRSPRNEPFANLHVYHWPPTPEHQVEEILTGLRGSPKRLAAKYFYDSRGSLLFDAITRLPEYYPTRMERQILRENLRHIQEILGPETLLIEPGSGDCRKARILLKDGRPRAYVPIEISAEALLGSARGLAIAYPHIEFHAIRADFTQVRELPRTLPDGPRTIFFPGSTIGNFEPVAAVRLLARLRSWIGQGGLLIGVDTRKDEALLHAAYNDRQGVTAAFNLNILRHVNRLTGADFDPEQFEHKAIYNADLGRVEMHLQSRKAQRVRVAGHDIRFDAGETIHTENSYKYSPEEFAQLAARAGFRMRHSWQDEDGLFAVHYLETHSDS